MDLKRSRERSRSTGIVFWICCATVMLATKDHNCMAEDPEYENEECGLLIPQGYKKIHPPPHAAPGTPIDIFTTLSVMDIDEINEETMDFRLNTYLTQTWNDSRLVSGYTSDDYILDDCYKHLWVPDINFESAKKVNTFPNVYFYVMSDGALYFTTRHSFKVGCLMNFRLYPFDTQICTFTISFMQTADSEALLKWVNHPSSPHTDVRVPIQMLKIIEPLQFSLAEPVVSMIGHEYYVENFTYLVANFTFVRRVTGSIVNIYAPSALIVGMSWVTFWINVEAAPARVALSITSLLTVCTQVTQYKSQLPPVNYLTAMDIWLFVCILMVFSTLLEFAISYNRFTRIKDDVKIKVPVQLSVEKSTTHPSQDLKRTAWTNSERNSTDGNKNSTACDILNEAGSLDVFCRKFFPISFLIFIIIYWIYFLKTS